MPRRRNSKNGPSNSDASNARAGDRVRICDERSPFFAHEGEVQSIDGKTLLVEVEGYGSQRVLARRCQPADPSRTS